ncbi:DUF4870 domain-containing protein [Chloroflexota bacterium]
MDKTSTRLTENVAGPLCYVLFWISGLVFLLIEQENKFVRFHALQSILTFGGIALVAIALSILGLIPVIGIVFKIASGLIGLLAFVLWIVLMVKAFQGTRYKLPWAGDFAERYSSVNNRAV